MRPLQYATVELSQMLSALMSQSAEEHGVMCALIWACFAHGSVPDDDAALAKIGRVSFRKFAKISSATRSHLIVGEDGRLHHPWVDFQLQRTENISEERRKSAHKSNAKQAQARHNSDHISDAIEPLKRIVNINKKESRSPTGSARLRRAPTAGFSLLDEGVKVLGARGKGIVRQMLGKCGSDRVREMLAAAEHKSPDDRIAYFLGGCNGELTDPDQPTWKFEGPKEPPPDRLYPEEP